MARPSHEPLARSPSMGRKTRLIVRERTRDLHRLVRRLAEQQRAARVIARHRDDKRTIEAEHTLDAGRSLASPSRPHQAYRGQGAVDVREDERRHDGHWRADGA